MRSLGPRETRELLERFGLHPRTAIGQHFITDPNTVRRIVEVAGVSPGDRILEVGPGLGALTLALVDAGADVIAIETDRRFAPILKEIVPEARILWGDAMRMDLGSLVGDVPTKMVANLPYQIATPLIIGCLENVPVLSRFTVMVQREVGWRLAAPPGDESYGAASAKLAYFAHASIPLRISRQVFFPMPEVESVIVDVQRHERAPYHDKAGLFAVINAGFGQRRKTIRKALRSGGWSPDAIERALAASGVAGDARAEVLGLDAFIGLATALGSPA